VDESGDLIVGRIEREGFLESLHRLVEVALLEAREALLEEVGRLVAPRRLGGLGPDHARADRKGETRNQSDHDSPSKSCPPDHDCFLLLVDPGPSRRRTFSPRLNRVISLRCLLVSRWVDLRTPIIGKGLVRVKAGPRGGPRASS